MGSGCNHSLKPQGKLTVLSLLDLPALKALWKERRWGQPSWQAFEKAYFEQLACSYEELEAVPSQIVAALRKDVAFFPLEVSQEFLAEDGTLKLLFETHDGLKFETVLMRYSAEGKADRFTVCVSSQIGCPARCAFCSTGTMKWSRNLRAEEIVAQVVYFNRRLKSQGANGARVNNIVFMGMGEPLLNYVEVKQALNMLLDQRKFNLGPRQISVSTVGIVPGIEQLLADQLPTNLAVSLHAPNDELRSRLIPINGSYPLATLFASLDRWTEQTGKAVFYQYVMLRGINDQPEHIQQLADWLKARPARLNLIPYNPGPALQDLDPTEREQIFDFAQRLRAHGLHVLIRHTFGQDIAAACGQLLVR
jgi:23S rRNA (adenine2503-C2)-methyltransferase